MRSALLAIYFILALGSARHDSPTYDEPLHVASGYSFLRSGVYWMDPLHPPLARVIEAAPLLILPLRLDTSDPAWRERQRYEFADRFLFENQVPFTRILMSARLMAMLMGAVLGLLLWFWARRLCGEPAANAALFFYALCPPILAHAHLATNDIAAALFQTLSLYLFWRLIGQPSPRAATLAGAALGAAVSVKYSALALLPILAALSRPLWPRKTLASWFAAGMAAAILLAFGVIRIPVFFSGLAEFFGRMGMGRSSFLAGSYSETGWPHYFLVAFLLKTPVPFLILLACAPRGVLARWVFFPAAAILAMASLSKVQIGHRHILPVYPLLCVAAGASAHKLWSGRGAAKAAALLLSLWTAGAAAATHPHHIAYFNELIGGSARGHLILSDSNVDWGQELGSLGTYLRERKIGGLYLSYLGTTDPRVYGIRSVPVYPVSNVPRNAPEPDLRAEQSVLIAVSATNLAGVYYRDHGAFAWLRGRRPEAVLGHSLFVYDITGDAGAHFELARMYHAAGLADQAGREFRWARDLEKRVGR